MECKITECESRDLLKEVKIGNHEIQLNEQCRYVDSIINKWRGASGMLK